MSIEIQAPNGDVVEFPEGTPDATILQVMRAEYGGSNSGPAPTPARPSGKGSNEAIDRPGIVDRVTDAFTGASRTDPEFANAPELGAALEQAARDRGTAGTYTVPSTGALINSAITPDPRAQIDILRREFPDLETRNDAHGNVLVRIPSQGVSEWAQLNSPGLSRRDLEEFAIPTLATLPISPLYGAGRSIAARIATGAAAGGASSVAQDAAAIAQGSEQGVDVSRAGLSAAFGGALGPLLGRPAAAPTGPRQAVLEAADRIDVPVPRAMATDSRAVNMVGGATRGLPFGSPLERAAENTTGRLGSAANQAAADVAGGVAPAGPLNAGDAARQGMLDWVQGGSQRVADRVYSTVDRLMPPGATSLLPETRVMATTLQAEMAQSGARSSQSAIDAVAQAFNIQGGITYEGLKALRTEIGARISGAITPEAGTSQPALKRIYEALTIDRNNLVFRSGNQQAIQALNRAESVFRSIVQRRDQVARIIGEKGDVAPERVFERLVAMAQSKGGDIQRLQQARQAMGPQAWNEVSSAAVARLGRGADDQFSPARFLTAYGKLSDSGKQLLFSSTGQAGQTGLRQSLDDIATVSRRYEQTMSKYANPSGTGRALVSAAGIGGMVTSPLETLALAAGGYSLASILSKPASAQVAARWTQAYLMAATKPSQATFTVLNQLSQQLSRFANSEQRAPQ